MAYSNTLDLVVPQAVGGIYSITNLSTGDQYIGRTKEFYKRWRQHRTRLRHKVHTSFLLQAAWDTYGEDAFRFDILEIIAESKAFQASLAEARWIAMFRPQYNGPIGGCSTRSKRHSYNRAMARMKKRMSR